MRDSAGPDRVPRTMRLGRWSALVASVAVFILYLFSLAPGIGPEDAGEFVTAAMTLGIPHPPGFPLYVLLGFPFAHLPGFSAAVGLNILSAIGGSVTVFFLARTLQAVRVSPFVAAVTATAFGVTGVFWAQAVVAEVYTLTLAFLSAAVYCLVRWVQVPDRSREAVRWLYGFAVLLGGALSVHPYLGLTVAPVAIAVLVWYRGQHPHSTRQWMAAGAFLLLGLTPYLFLPIRSAMNPALDWGNPERLSSLVAHVSRQDYGDLELAAADAAGRYDLLGSFLGELWAAYTPFFVGAGVIGLWWVVRTRNALLLLLSFGIVVNTVAVLFFRDQPSGLETSYIYQPYYLVSIFLFALLVGQGLQAVWQLVHSLIRSRPMLRRAGTVVLVLAAVTVPAVHAADTWGITTAAHRPYVSEYADAILRSLPQDAVLVVKAPGLHLDTLIFGLMHAQAVEHLRPDVTVLTLVQAPGFFPAIPDATALPPDYRTRSFVEQEYLLLEHAFGVYGNTRPIYTTYTTDRWADGSYIFRSNGLVYRAFLPDAVSSGDAGPLVSLGGLDQPPVAGDPFTRELRASISYARAAYFIEHGDRGRQLEELLRAIDADTTPMSHTFRNFVAHRDTLDRALRPR